MGSQEEQLEQEDKENEEEKVAVDLLECSGLPEPYELKVNSLGLW